MGSSFVDELSCHMLDLYAKNGSVAPEFFDLAIYVIRIDCKTLAKIHHQLVRPIIHNMNSTEYDHTSDIE